MFVIAFVESALLSLRVQIPTTLLAFVAMAFHYLVDDRDLKLAYSSLSVNDWDRTVGRTDGRTDSRTEGRWSFTTNSSVLNDKTCQCIKTIAGTCTMLVLTLPYR